MRTSNYYKFIKVSGDISGEVTLKNTSTKRTVTFEMKPDGYKPNEW